MLFLCVSLASSLIGQWTQVWSASDLLFHVEQVTLFNITNNFFCRHFLQLRFVIAFLCFSDSLSSEVPLMPFLCSSDISRILWNATVRCIDKYPPLIPVLSQLNPFHHILGLNAWSLCSCLVLWTETLKAFLSFVSLMVHIPSDIIFQSPCVIVPDWCVAAKLQRFLFWKKAWLSLKVYHPRCVRSIIQSCSVCVCVYIYIYVYIQSWTQHYYN